MSLVNLSLDEIIARRKNVNKKSNIAIKSFNNNGRKKEYPMEYSAKKTGFTRPEDVPVGKWDHSGFEELYGEGGGGSAVPIIQRVERFKRLDLARKVRLHITNLAPTVNSADLSELLEEYSIVSANVNFDELGQSVGTADVVTDRATAKEIVANLNGVALDGEVMSFHVIDDEGVFPNRKLHVKKRLTFRERPWNAIKKNPLKHVVPPKNRRRIGTRRSQMTDEELDRELEEYMNKRTQKQTDQTMET